eukprot:3322481-Rhodomonas_salina.1
MVTGAVTFDIAKLQLFSVCFREKAAAMSRNPKKKGGENLERIAPEVDVAEGREEGERSGEGNELVVGEIDVN